MKTQKVVKVKINGEFTIYTTPEKIEELEKEGSVLFENGCYDVMLEKKDYGFTGWYKRYGTLYRNKKTGIWLYFQDGDGWKIYRNTIENLPIYDTQNNLETGFYNLQREPSFDEDMLEAYSCYLYEEIHYADIEEGE